jgi:putative membrane protein
MPPTPAPLDTGTRLAVERTFLAHERTMMAWVRTAASMISFGFTIYKFFQLELSKSQAQVEPLVGAREFALILIAIGIGSLVLAYLEHHRSVRMMRGHYGNEVVPKSIAGMVAAVVGVLGVLAILMVTFRQ